MSTEILDQQQTISNFYALFGGTFDPIHYGHLRPVEVLAQQLGLQQVILLPNHVPPHRPQPEANPWQRLKMVELAVANNPLFRIDTRELQSSNHSYIINTLEIIRQQQGVELPLAFIIGQDSLLRLHKWHKWQSLLDICHLLVCARPGYNDRLINTKLQRWLSTYQTDNIKKLNQQPKGYIYLANTPLLDISATDIRRRYHQKQCCDYLLPSSVQQYIKMQNLYC